VVHLYLNLFVGVSFVRYLCLSSYCLLSVVFYCIFSQFALYIVLICFGFFVCLFLFVCFVCFFFTLLLTFSIVFFRNWAYLMKVTPTTRRALTLVSTFYYFCVVFCRSAFAMLSFFGHCINCPSTIYYFPVFAWAYLMKVIPETCRTQYIRRSHHYQWVDTSAGSVGY
jgi:hypothetical protein